MSTQKRTHVRSGLTSLLLTALVLAGIAFPARAAVLDSIRVSPHYFSPNGDKSQDTTRLVFNVTADSARVVVAVHGPRTGFAGQDTLGTLLAATLFSGSDSIAWGGHSSRGALPDSTYWFWYQAWNLSDPTDSLGPDSLPVIMDRAGPRLHRAVIVVGDSVLKNGDPLELRYDWDQPGYTVTASFINLDSYIYAPPLITPSDTSSIINYTISGDSLNHHPDGKGLQVVVTAADSAGNRLVNRTLSFCLNNHNPVLLGWEKREPWRTGYHNGELIKLATFWDRSAIPESILADFSGIDGTVTGFAPATIGVDSTGTVRISHFLPKENPDRQDATYPVPLIARDADCGETHVDSIYLKLDNLPPPFTPLLDSLPFATESRLLPVHGHAPGSPYVVVLREATGALALAETLTVGADSSFSGVDTLEAGANAIIVYGMSTSGTFTTFGAQDSVHLMGAAALTVPKRFRPNDKFILQLDRDAVSIAIELRNLAGERVAELQKNAPGRYFEVPWDGRNGAGETVYSGPFLAAVVITFADGSHQHEVKPFFFSRE